MPRTPPRTAIARLAAMLFAVATLLPFSATAATVKVEGRQNLVDGKPFTPRGVDGQTRLGLLPGLGANTRRPYGDETGYVLDEAPKHGLKVMAGLCSAQPRTGFHHKKHA